MPIEPPQNLFSPATSGLRPPPVQRRKRPTALVALALMLIAFGATVPTASSAPVTRPTLVASTTFAVFNQRIRLTGGASAKTVTLFARHFGQSGFRPVATARVRGGRFEFAQVPGLATQYKVSEGTHQTTLSRPVQVYVHLDVQRFSCSLCEAHTSTGEQQLKYSLVIRVPASDYQFVSSQPVFLYVGTSAGKVQAEKRVGQVSPRRLGHSTVRVSGSILVNLPSGWKLHFTACDRSEERRTGVGLPAVHDCGAPRLSHSQFVRYVG